MLLHFIIIRLMVINIPKDGILSLMQLGGTVQKKV